MTYGSKGTAPLGPGRARCGPYPDGSPARVAFNWVIVHTSEQSIDSDRTNDAEALLAFLRTSATSDNVAGYNAVADTDGWYDLIDDQCRAFAAPPTNGTGLHICLPVRMRGMTRADWLHPSVTPFLDVAAAYIVYKSTVYDLPLQRVSDQQMRDGVKGYADHWTVSRAFGKTDHSDCGAAFPWDYLAGAIFLPPPPQEDDDVIVRQRWQGYNNVFLLGAGGAEQLTPETAKYFETAGVQLVVSKPHPQSLKSALHQAGLTAADLVPNGEIPPGTPDLFAVGCSVMPENLPVPVGERIRRLRLARRLKPIELATEAGISQRSVYNLEANHDVLVSNLLAVADASGTSAADLLADEDD